MSALLSRRSSPKHSRTSAVLLPGNRFFTRTINLETADAGAEVSLAMEALSPFPAEHMLMGFVISADNKQVLAYAAHRRRFTAEESFTWPDHCQVIPEFLTLCGMRPEKAGVLIHVGDERLTALAWADTGALPIAVLSVNRDETQIDALAAEIIARAGLTDDTTVRTLNEPLEAELTESQLTLHCGPGSPYILNKSQLDQADIRDADFLAERRKKGQFNHLLWNTARVAMFVLALSLLLEIGASFITWRANELRTSTEARRPLIQEIESAQALSARITELSTQSPMPLEMLSLANQQRPATVDFQRINCKTNNAIEVEARTSNASDITTFERALKERPEVISVASRDIRARDTLTTFTFTITFKPEALRAAKRKK